jgi:hypothetical protein
MTFLPQVKRIILVQFSELVAAVVEEEEQMLCLYIY